MSYKLDVKRLRLPFKIDITCKECGHQHVLDLETDRHLSYPIINEFVNFCVMCPECLHETCDHRINLNVSLQFE
jgi:ribosomal protein S27E